MPPSTTTHTCTVGSVETSSNRHRRLDCDRGGSRRDAPAAAAYAAHLAQRNLSLLTTNYVLSEAYTRIRYDDGHARTLAFDAIVQEMTRKRHLTVRWVYSAIHEAALEIFRKYSDHNFSIADCASFVVGREKNVHEVFGFDKHFVTMGFTLRPA